MDKETLTLEEKFNKYENKVFCVINTNVKGRSYIKFKIVGYRDGKSNWLIGKLVGNLGITQHFKNPTGKDIVKNHVEGNNYYYVNLRMIERYPTVKKVVSKSERINEINLEDFVF